MKVAFVRLGATPLVAPDCPQTFGGAEVRALTFARGVARSTTHDVSLVVQRPPGGKITWGDTESSVRVESVRHSRSSNNATRLARRLRRSVRNRLTNVPPAPAELRPLLADVTIAFGVHSPTPSLVRCGLLQNRSVVVALTSDEDARRALSGEGRRSSKENRTERAHRYALLSANAVMVQTETQRMLVEQAGQRAVLIRNPIATCLKPNEAVPLRKRQYVLWVGRADTDCKRADLAMEVARRCPNVPFLMVMNPTNRDKNSRHPIVTPANVRVVSSIDWQESDSLFRDARALLNTSESEGFPNAFLQAAKFGVPIVSRRVNPDETLTRFGIGFVANDDLDATAKMVQNIFDTPDRFEHVGRAARNYVVGYHDLGDRVDELDRFLLSSTDAEQHFGRSAC